MVSVDSSRDQDNPAKILLLPVGWKVLLQNSPESSYNNLLL